MAMQDTTPRNGRTRRYVGTPGHDELLELRVYTKRRRYAAGPTTYVAELRGLVDLYCPNGMHRVEVTADGFGAPESAPSEEDRLVIAAREGDEAAASELTDLLSAYALEEWFCGCPAA